jgi:ribosomal protein S27AE
MNGEPEYQREGPYAWLTRDKFLKFVELAGISKTCPRCGKPDFGFIDTGDDGVVPRFSAFKTTSEGYVDLATNYHMAAVRTACKYCGNMSFFASFIIDLWIHGDPNQGDVKLAASPFPAGAVDE